MSFNFLKTWEKNRCSKSDPRYDFLEYLGRGLSSCILFKALGDFDAKAELGPMGEEKGIFILYRCEYTCDCMWEGSSWEQDSTTKKIIIIILLLFNILCIEFSQPSPQKPDQTVGSVSTA